MTFCSEKWSKVVRMMVMIKSAVWWIVFLMGFGLVLTAIKKQAKDSDADSDFTPDPGVVRVVTGPMWLFLVSAPLLYITYTLQIFMNTKNSGNVLHCIAMFFTFFYTSAAILTITIGILYVDKNTTQYIIAVLPSQQLTAMKMILIGTTFSVITFWFGLGLWPLLNIKRSRYRGYTELQESARH